MAKKEIEDEVLEKVKHYGKIGAAVVVVLLLVFMSVYTIPAGYRGVVLTFGKPSDTIATEGIHVKIPIAQSVQKIEVRTQKIEVGADSASKDLQDVQTTIALNYHVNPGFANKLYQEVGLEYKSRIIDPAIQENVKAVTAKYNAEELISKRPEVKILIQQQLEERLSKYYVNVDDFNIVNFQFSEEFDKAIEQKVTAEQLKLKAERDLERIRIEAQQKEAEAIGTKNAMIAEAEGDAQRIATINAQLSQSPLYLEWMKVDRWDGVLPKYTGGAMPFIQLNDEK